MVLSRLAVGLNTGWGVRCRPLFLSSRLASSSFDRSPTTSSISSCLMNEKSPNDAGGKTREEVLLEKLHEIGIDAEGLNNAALNSIQDPMLGYDGAYGKSAIKTFRSFLHSKRQDDDPLTLIASAGRCAQQISFLLKRHQSHQSEWVRHHDNSNQVVRNVFPLVLLLDNVRSAFNVGSIFRTADAAGCEQVITTGITPHPNGSGADKLQKSALGADLVMPSRHFATTREALRYLREDLPEYEIVGVETTEKSLLYTKQRFSRKGVVLVLGNEVTGVDTELLPECDSIVEIPMFRAKNSLNIAACAPVVLYEVIRQWSTED
jgi:23S rRNA (guanosine2251-2'-O)-methyltransferase